MNRTHFSASLALALAATLAASPVAFAEPSQSQAFSVQSPAPPSPAHMPDPHRQAMRLSEELNLTPDQTAKIEPILADRDRKIAGVRADSSIDPKTGKKQIRAIQQATRQQMSTVLTPQQLEQFDTIRPHSGKRQAQPATTPTV